MKTFRLLLPIFALSLATAAVDASVTESFSQTYPLNPDGGISLNNVNGPVEIVVWDKAEVSIDAIKEASDTEALKHIQIKVDSSPAKLTVKTDHDTTWKFWDRFHASVRYTLHVPRGAHLEKINTVNANITATGVQGAVDLETVNGNIHATGLRADAELESVNGKLSASFDSLEKVQRVELKSVNGSAEVTLPKSASATISTRSVNGSTHVDQAIKLEKSGRLGVAGQIGSGGPSITLKTVNGRISVHEQ